MDEPVPVAPAVPNGKNPVTPTVVKAIVLGFGLQIVMVALAIGMRMEPAPSEPWASGPSPAATAEPAPPEEAPEVRSRFHGLAHGGPSRLSHMSL